MGVRTVPDTARPGRTVRARLLLAALAMGAAAAAPLAPGTAAAAPWDGGASRDGWSAGPAGDSAAAGGDSATRSRFYLEGEPGAVLRDTVTVANNGGRTRTFRLRGSGAEGTGDWLAFAGRTVRVPAYTRAEVPFTATVPTAATPGDRSAAVLVSAGERTQRVPLRLRVPGPRLAALGVEHVRVRDTDSGAAEITYTLVNRGNTTLSPRLSVHADGVFGQLLNREPRSLGVELPPGGRKQLRERWPAPPALDAADVRLRATAAGGAEAEGNARYTTVPWTLAALPVVAAAAGGAVYLRARRRRSEPGPGAAPAARHGTEHGPEHEGELTAATGAQR